MSAMLQIDGLVRHFDGVRAVDDVSFTVDRGQVLGFIGPNGAGKTTFVNLITGRLRASFGSVLLNDVDITDRGEAQRIQLGIGRTFQITSLFPSMTVRENVFLAVMECEGIAGKLFRPVFHHRQQVERVDELVHRLGLGDVAHVPAQLLPYGRQRLLEIAIALALRPRILLLDEPAAGIPTAQSHVILEIIAALPKDIAVLLIDHDMDFVFRFAQQISVLVQGSILVEGTPQEIASDPRVREVYLGSSHHGRAVAA